MQILPQKKKKKRHKVNEVNSLETIDKNLDCMSRYLNIQAERN